MSNELTSQQAFTSQFLRGLTMPPPLWVDAWSENNIIIPKGNAEPGPYRVAKTPYAQRVMQVLSPEHPCQKVVLRANSQTFKTQVGINWVLSLIHGAPANILIYMPTEAAARKLSQRISKAIDACPALYSKVAEPRSRDAKNTISVKEFDGGTLFILSAGSVNNLMEINAKYLWMDELSRTQQLAIEGDPRKPAEARLTTYGARAKIFYTSTPTIKDLCLISEEFEAGNQQEYFVKCPHCQHAHALKVEQLVFDGVTASMACPSCAVLIDEAYKPQLFAIENCEWKPQHTSKIQSFQSNAFYSPIGWLSWAQVAKERDAANAMSKMGDDSLITPFFNTRLGLPYDNTQSITTAQALQARATDYRLGTVPDGGLILVAGVDTQGDRLEYLCLAFGINMECWVVDYRVFNGNPSLSPSDPLSPWFSLDEHLKAPLTLSNGQAIHVRAGFIDSGGGYTQDVYNFTRARKHRHIYSIKGSSVANKPIVASKPSKVDINFRGKTDIKGGDIWILGTDTAKNYVFSRLGFESGAGAIHFSEDLPLDFYEGLLSERVSTVMKRGRKVQIYTPVKGVRNEPLDTFVYALAAAHYLGLHRWSSARWDEYALKINPLVGDLFAPNVAAPVASTPAITKPTPNPFTNGKKYF